ncbi:DUF6262 family protein [Clostridium taeniosporum]|uniref:Transposase n=1 Tax=Clostridium taeniosporum TaxID=394958 RepID=A0A1D7XME9_9CLOT|nr:DUF6262 family protein [Clostridium taeniosporum]AOR24289.1 transposase [Clostridium taeniosporum]AOR24318.1 transposase [Clostridium taeniosporum]
MSNKTNININGLQKYAKEKKEKTLNKVDLAIRTLIKNQKNINFNSVAQTSGVSKAYLYNNKDVRNRIETLREKGFNTISSKRSSKITTESAKDIIIASKNKKIKDLETENRRLKEELMILRGKLYDSI